VPNRKVRFGADASPAGRVPAEPIEQMVLAQIHAELTSPEMVQSVWNVAREKYPALTEPEVVLPLRPEHDAPILTALSRAFHWQRLIDEGIVSSGSDIARREAVQTMLLHLVAALKGEYFLCVRYRSVSKVKGRRLLTRAPSGSWLAHGMEPPRRRLCLAGSRGTLRFWVTPRSYP
jgi:hypothetical protein